MVKGNFITIQDFRFRKNHIVSADGSWYYLLPVHCVDFYSGASFVY